MTLKSCTKVWVLNKKRTGKDVRSVSRVKDGNYVTIQWFSVKKLNLKGNELIVYSIIYGFSQNNQEFNGSLQYLADWTNSTRQSIQGVLKSLLQKGLIVKSYTSTDKVSTNRYRAVDINELESESEGCTKKLYRGVQKSCTEGVQKSLHNNILLEDSNNIDTGDFSSPDSVDADFYNIPPSTPNEKSTMYEEDLATPPPPDENFQPHAVGKCDFPNSGKKPRKKKAFVPPTLEEVRAYVAERGSPVDADYFFDYYNVENWTVGGKPVLSWKMKLVTWEKNNKKNYTTNDTFGVTFNSPMQTNETTTGGEADEHKPFAGCY